MAREICFRANKFFEGKLQKLEESCNLPGDNTVELNYLRWNSHDWSKDGEEWTPSEEWKSSLIEDIMLKYIKTEGTMLEIGPGGGRWSEALQKIAERLILVDLSDSCIERCKERFRQCENVEYYVNNGSSLNFIPDDSIDYIWSFDVFVHLKPTDIEKYLIEFNRVLRDGGYALIHHAAMGRKRGGWRSNMTTEKFRKLLAQYNFNLVSQIDSWGQNGEHNLHGHQDIISVFRK